MTIFYLVAAWVAGIFLASTSTSTSSAIWLGFAVGGLFLAYRTRHQRPWRIGFICLALFALGASRYTWATRPLPTDHIAHYNDTGYITFTGIITRDADVRDQHVNLHIRAKSISWGFETLPTEGLVLVQAPRYGDYKYGDRVVVTGQILTPPEFDDFSYRDYLARRGIHAMIPDADVTLVERDQGQPWYALMYDLKGRAQATIDRLLPSPQAPLLSGILLGVESAISPAVRDAFNQTGTTHIIAISGANMVVVIGVLLKLLEPPLGKRRASIGALIGVGVYTLFVGADPAIVRAAIMGGLSLVAMQTGRRVYGFTTLAFTIWLMTLLNPLTLWDVGFQLSVASTAGLILFNKDMEALFIKALERGFASTTARKITRRLSEPVIVSLAAQITTTPLMLIYFERFSVIAILANILIVPAQAYIMTLGWSAVLLSLIWLPLGQPLAWIVWLPLSYTLEVVRSLGQYKWASTGFEPSTTSIWLIYAGLTVFAFLRFQHPEDRAAMFMHLRQRISAVAVITVGVIVSILVWIVAFQQPDGKLHVWFLDIGNGHAVLIQTPDGAQILVDGGPNPTRLRQTIGDALPFWDRDLDLLIVTQPKAESVGALPELLDHYAVELALTTGHDDRSDLYQTLAQAWEKHQINVQTVTAGYTIQTSDGVKFEILHPQTPPDYRIPASAAGMIIRVSYGDTSFLLTPNLSEEAELDALNAGWYVGSTVLELSASGSDNANPAFFVGKVDPQLAVVTVDAGNRIPLPTPTIMDRLKAAGTETLYRTDQQGTVEMVTDGHTLWIYTGK